MLKLSTRFALSAMVLALAGVNASAAESIVATTGVSGIDKKNNDTSVRIQDDFYRHVNGAWLKNTEIPADKSSWGAFSGLREAVLPNLQAIITSLASNPNNAPGSDAQKIGDLYASYMDTATIEAAGLKPLEATFAQIAAL
ncbi:MAG: M13 family peptidase, partial [Pseudomonadota bacterium]